MRPFRLASYALIVAIVAVLSACAGSGGPGEVVPSQNLADGFASNHKLFRYTGAAQKFVVPSGVTRLTVVAYGAQGGGQTSGNYSEPPGLGGKVSAVVPVLSGEKLYVFVGGEGSFKDGGFNGGGQGGSSEYGTGFRGGGASDLREGGKTLSDRILVAGGGGGAGGGYYDSGAGGAGGGLIGGRGCCDDTTSENGIGGSGGTQRAGGTGGAGGGSGSRAGQAGADGVFGIGGDGGASGVDGQGYESGFSGAGGGGGYYGGGGGGGGEPDYQSGSTRGGSGGGGGGGSSYAEPKANHVRNVSGVRQHNGLVTISW